MDVLKFAIVVTTLRPFGYVEFNGQRTAATTTSGSFLDVGKTVRIRGQRNNTLLVEECLPPNS